MISTIVKGVKIYLWSSSHSMFASVVSVQIGPGIMVDERLLPRPNMTQTVIIDGPEYEELILESPGFTDSELLSFAVVATVKKQKRLTDEVTARESREAEIIADAAADKEVRIKEIAEHLTAQIEASRLRQIKRESDDAKRHSARKAARVKRKKDRAAAQAIIDQAERDNPKAHH